MFDIEFNEKKASSLGLLVKNRPNIPSPEEKTEEIDIRSRDGMLIRSFGSYKDISITVPMNYMSNENEWLRTYREAKRWLLSKGSRRLVLSDDPEVFYKVKKVVIGENERTSLRIGNFSPIFTCDPYSYLKAGLSEYSPADVRYNPGALCHPEYLIKGNGMCILTVNGKNMRAVIGQNLTINTDLMIAYRADGSISNASVAGNYEDLYLAEGDNEISISNGFELKIIPNWRCL